MPWRELQCRLKERQYVCRSYIAMHPIPMRFGIIGAVSTASRASAAAHSESAALSELVISSIATLTP
jgi:hypothetical protein